MPHSRENQKKRSSREEWCGLIGGNQKAHFMSHYVNVNALHTHTRTKSSSNLDSMKQHISKLHCTNYTVTAKMLPCHFQPTSSV